MNRFLAVSAFIAVFLVACDQNEPIVATQPGQIKLDYYVETFNIDGLGFTPQLKVAYEYDDQGNLKKSVFSGYNTSTNKMEEQRSLVFSYVAGRIDKIEGFFVNTTTPHVKDVYQYQADGKVSKITENNYAAGANSEANFSYLPDDVIKVAYQYSNGGSFQYEFRYGSQNILSDITTSGSQHCSDGVYTYDDRKNPFRTLGYVDYLLFNMSTNNKLTESVNYVGCSFPSLRPESFEYEYDSNGFPTTATTNYKSDNTAKKSQKKFFYKTVN